MSLDVGWDLLNQTHILNSRTGGKSQPIAAPAKKVCSTEAKIKRVICITTDKQVIYVKAEYKTQGDFVEDLCALEDGICIPISDTDAYEIILGNRIKSAIIMKDLELFSELTVRFQDLVSASYELYDGTAQVGNWEKV
jgi:hypothetical protein